MFVVIPYRSDALARTFPWGTVGLMAANVAIAALLGFPRALPSREPAFIDRFVLRFGTIDPFTWLASAFTHVDWLHVAGNMVFLWAFGFIAEAILGLRRFLLVYAALAMVPSAATQLLLLGASGGAVGASSAIMGLMVLSGLWAPRNTLSVFVWIFMIIRLTEIKVIRFCVYFLAIELVLSFLKGFRASSELLHLLGACGGLGVGLTMLRKGWVDTEGLDYFSLRRGHPRSRSRSAAPPPSVDPRVEALVAVRDALEEGEAWRAESAYAAGQRASPGFLLPLPELTALIGGLRSGGHLLAAIDRMEEFLAADPRAPASLRLALAQDLLEARRPAHAREVLEAIAAGSLPAEEEAVYRSLLARCREIRSDGALELN
ncbi:MAG: rhomboid family intramembrane serine protease [Planctomycetaceae bacterium]